MLSFAGLAPALRVVAVLAVLTTGCTPRSDVLATVGDQTITVAEFENVARRMQGQYPPLPPDTVKTLLYEDLLRRALMLEYAKRTPILVDSLVDHQRTSVETEVLQSELFVRLAPRDVPVSEAEVRQLYAWRDSATKLQLVYAVDRRVADQAMAAIRRGEDFSAVADRYNLAGLLPPGGVLDFLAPGALVNPLDEILRTGRPGQIVGPVQAPGEGWFIVRVIARQPRQQEPYEQQQAVLAQALQQRKRRLLSVRAFQTLRDQYRVETDPAGVRALFERFNMPEGMAGPADPKRVLAHYDDGTGRRVAYTLGDAERDFELDPRDRPNGTILPAFSQWIESRVVRRVAVIEARRRHLHEEPEIKKTIDERVHNYMLEGIYESAVVHHAVLAPEDLMAAYQRRAGSLVTLRSATVQRMVLPDSEAAARVIELAQRAPTMREAILHSSAGLQVQEEVVRFPTTSAPWSALEYRIREMTPGAYGEPVQTEHGWLVYQLISKDQQTPSIETLPDEIRMGLQSEALERSRERRLRALTDSLRHALPVVEHRDRLKRIPWPPSGNEAIGLTG